MDMEKLTKKEMEIFELITCCNSRDEVFRLSDTTQKYFNVCLSGIYDKTKDFVNYRTERNKFEELQEYCKKNPTFLTPFTGNKKIDERVLQTKIELAIARIRENLLCVQKETDMQIKVLNKLENELIKSVTVQKGDATNE